MSLQRKINKLAPYNGYIIRNAEKRVEKDQRREMTGSPGRAHGKSYMLGPSKLYVGDTLRGMTGPVTITVEDRNPPLKADKGKADGSCNRTACQSPLAEEFEHQFMDGNFTGGPRLHYCEKCAADFDKWDHQSGDRVRIKREWKEGVV